MAAQPVQISFDNFAADETVNAVNTPKSLEACRQEGVEPSFLLYRPVESFAAPGKPPAVQEQEFQQFENQRKSFVLPCKSIGLLVRLRYIRWQLVQAEERKKINGSPEVEQSRIASRRSASTRVGESESVLPQLKHHYQLLKKRVDKIEKEQDREYARLFTLIEQREKETESQKALEELKNKEEQRKILTEAEKQMLKRFREERDLQLKKEKERLKRQQLEMERKNAYNRMLNEIQAKNIAKYQREEYLKSIVEGQQKSREEWKRRRQEYIASLNYMNERNELKKVESDAKILERRKKYAQSLNKIKEEVKEKRQWREYRHLCALEVAEETSRLRSASIESKIKEESMRKTSRGFLSVRGNYRPNMQKTIDSSTKEKIEKVKEEAEKRHQQKLAEMATNMQLGQLRVEEQRKKLEDRIALQKMKRSAQMQFKNKNVERQKKKDEYRKEKLKKMQEEQNRKIKEFVEGKESLFSQSQYLQAANDLRKYYLKREVEGGCLTIDKIMDINEKFKPKDFQLNASLKPAEVRKMLTRMMSRPVHSSAANYGGIGKPISDNERCTHNGDPLGINNERHTSFDNL